MIRTIATAKKIHRFLLSSLPAATVGEIITISDPRVCHQVHRVLKIQPGESIVVFINDGPNITIEIIGTEPEALTARIISIVPSAPVPHTLIAAISIVKSDNFELIVQKLTEIGISTIVPLITARTIKQAVRGERLQAISNEALEQSGGTRRVHITEPLTLKECFEQYPYQSVVLDPLAIATSSKLSDDTAVFYVGPEGGWSEQDEATINLHNPLYLQITQRVLRTETAAILAAYALLWQD